MRYEPEFIGAREGLRCLDFLVVGAQKSGTTALFEYLRKHPSIFLPSGKEAPFFNIDSYYERGYASFLRDYFSHAAPAARWGVISPQYMTSQKIVRRVADTLPETHIIALLRDPVSRAISHYKMAFRRGQEKRPIDQALIESLDGARLSRARQLPAAPSSESECYVAWSEYGRILTYYRQLYDSERILILFLEDLVANPGETLDRLLSFLGLPVGYRPENLGAKVFAGTTSVRFPRLKDALRQSSFGSLWKHLPRATRGRLSFVFERLNSSHSNSAQEQPVNPSDETQSALLEFFRSDVAALEKTFGVSAPWTRFSTSDLGSSDALDPAISGSA